MVAAPSTIVSFEAVTPCNNSAVPRIRLGSVGRILRAAISQVAARHLERLDADSGLEPVREQGARDHQRRAYRQPGFHSAVAGKRRRRELPLVEA